jgi:hypothetical protein
MCLSRKAVYNWVEKSLKDVRNWQMMPDQERKWLRQQSKDCVFQRTGKAMGQIYQCWWWICREKNVFSRLEYHIFYVLYPFLTYLLTLPRTFREREIAIAINFRILTYCANESSSMWTYEVYYTT